MFPFNCITSLIVRIVRIIDGSAVALPSIFENDSRLCRLFRVERRARPYTADHLGAGSKGKRKVDSGPRRNYPGGVQRAVIELKVLRKTLEHTLAEGLAQTWESADRGGAAEAHLVIFDRRPGRTWEEKIWQRSEQHAGLAITVWGM